MNFSNAAFDLAAARIEQERDAGVKAAGIALSQPGTAECIDCGCPIPSSRRLAFPSAKRCIGCQTLLEAEKYHR